MDVGDGLGGEEDVESRTPRRGVVGTGFVCRFDCRWQIASATAWPMRRTLSLATGERSSTFAPCDSDSSTAGGRCSKVGQVSLREGCQVESRVGSGVGERAGRAAFGDLPSDPGGDAAGTFDGEP